MRDLRPTIVVDLDRRSRRHDSTHGWHDVGDEHDDEVRADALGTVGEIVKASTEDGGTR